MMCAAGCFPDPDDTDSWSPDHSPCRRCERAPVCEAQCAEVDGFNAKAPLAYKFGANDGMWVTPDQSRRIAVRMAAWFDGPGDWEEYSGPEYVTVIGEVDLPEMIIPVSHNPGTVAHYQLSNDPEGIKDIVAEFIAFCRTCGSNPDLDGFEVW